MLTPADSAGIPAGCVAGEVLRASFADTAWQHRGGRRRWRVDCCRGLAGFTGRPRPWWLADAATCDGQRVAQRRGVSERQRCCSWGWARTGHGWDAAGGPDTALPLREQAASDCGGVDTGLLPFVVDERRPGSAAAALASSSAARIVRRVSQPVVAACFRNLEGGGPSAFTACTGTNCHPEFVHYT